MRIQALLTTIGQTVMKRKIRKPLPAWFAAAALILTGPAFARPGDGPASEFCYDGKIMAAYAPAFDLIAYADTPPAIDATSLRDR
jgi:hypothetical protein